MAETKQDDGGKANDVSFVDHAAIVIASRMLPAKPWKHWTNKQIAEGAYNLADALVAEKRKRESTS